MTERIRDQRPLLVPPPGADLAAYASLAARLGIPLVVSGSDLNALATAAVDATRAGVADILLEPPGADLREIHHSLSAIRRGALDRIHPGLGHPVFLRIAAGEFEKAVLGITKFASLLTIEDHGDQTWLPLWTLRQNIYTDPQKPLQMQPGVYSIGEPDPTVTAPDHHQLLTDLLHCLDGTRSYRPGLPSGGGGRRGLERAHRLGRRQVLRRPRS